jgi:hypothetical protein
MRGQENPGNNGTTRHGGAASAVPTPAAPLLGLSDSTCSHAHHVRAARALTLDPMLWMRILEDGNNTRQGPTDQGFPRRLLRGSPDCPYRIFLVPWQLHEGHPHGRRGW